MKVAVTNHHRTLVGGTESYLNGVIPALEAAGHQVLLVHEAAAGTGPSIEVAHSSAIWADLASFQPDLIFNHGLQSPEREYALADLAPVIHFAHNYHGTCISGEKTRKLPHPEACPRRFGPACLAEYLPRNCGGWNPLVALRDYNTQSARLSAIERATLVVTASRHMEAEYRNHGIRNILRAPLFVTQTPQPLPAPPNAAPYRILFAGRMTRIKGAHLLAHAAKHIPFPAQLTFAGEGPEKSALQRLAPDAHFPGWLSQPDLRAVAAQHHLFVMPSIWPEPFGLAGLELALPVAAFKVGGIPDWLEDGYNGALAERIAPEALATAIVRCSQNPEARANMHKAAQRFTLAQHMAILLPALESSAGTSPVSGAKHQGRA